MSTQDLRLGGKLSVNIPGNAPIPGDRAGNDKDTVKDFGGKVRTVVVYFDMISKNKEIYHAA